MGHQFFPSFITIYLLSFLRLSLIWTLAILSAVIVTDIKTFPLVWHVSFLPSLDIPISDSYSDFLLLTKLRLLNALRFVLPSQRAKPYPTSDSIFQPLVTSSHCSLSEIDFNWHSKAIPLYFQDHNVIIKIVSKVIAHATAQSLIVHTTPISILREHI